MSLVRIGDVSDIRDGSRIEMNVEGKDIIVSKVEGQVYAFEGRCTHAKRSLTDCKTDGHEIICTTHGARFDIRTGKSSSFAPASDLRTYDVIIKDDKVFVDITFSNDRDLRM